jgi:arsenate reductase
MAEALARSCWEQQCELFSASINTLNTDPLSCTVLEELGINTAICQTKKLEEIKDKTFDYVITLGDKDSVSTKLFAEDARVIHLTIDDPCKMGEATEDKMSCLPYYRLIRDEIKLFVIQLENILTESRTN